MEPSESATSHFGMDSTGDINADIEATINEAVKNGIRKKGGRHCKRVIERVPSFANNCARYGPTSPRSTLGGYLAQNFKTMSCGSAKILPSSQKIHQNHD